MKPLYTLKEFNNSKSEQKLPCKCYQCGNTFFTLKKLITYELKHKRGKIKYCNHNCYTNANKKLINLKCKNCNVKFQKTNSEYIKTKNHFCSRTCSVSYNNKNKSYGTRRSKLEIWLEDQLNNLYPNLDILFNEKETIGSELDIHIPSLNLAFELNGIFHYEPIYGEDKLQQILENDQSKSKACHENKIDLCIIDTSSQKYFKPKTSKKYLDIITTIINQRTH